MDKNNSWGEWAFVLGILLASILGFFPSLEVSGNVGLILAILGLVVGLLNITKSETQGFLIASIAFLLVGNANLNQLPIFGSALAAILLNISYFVAPAALVVSLKAVINLAKRA